MMTRKKKEKELVSIVIDYNQQAPFFFSTLELCLFHHTGNHFFFFSFNLKSNFVIWEVQQSQILVIYIPFLDLSGSTL